MKIGGKKFLAAIRKGIQTAVFEFSTEKARQRFAEEAHQKGFEVLLSEGPAVATVKQKLKFDPASLTIIKQLEQKFASVLGPGTWPADMQDKVSAAWAQFCKQHPRLNPLSVRFNYKCRGKHADFLVTLEPVPTALTVIIRWAKPGAQFKKVGRDNPFPVEGVRMKRRSYYMSDLQIPDTLPEGW